jgi:hypothetical protein
MQSAINVPSIQMCNLRISTCTSISSTHPLVSRGRSAFDVDS